MSMRTPILCVALLGAVAAAPYAAEQPPPAALSVEVSVATLHAATLTTARGSDDRADEPYLLASILGPGSATSGARLPNHGHLSIQLDEAVGARPLTTLALPPGETARVVIAAIEGPNVDLALETRVATAATARRNETPSSLAARLPALMAPLTTRGDHWLGSALLDVTNEAGAVRWRTFACLATCEVLSAPDASTSPGTRLAGVLEFSGARGIYHLKLETRPGR